MNGVEYQTHTKISQLEDNEENIFANHLLMLKTVPKKIRSQIDIT